MRNEAYFVCQRQKNVKVLFLVGASHRFYQNRIAHDIVDDLERISEIKMALEIVFDLVLPDPDRQTDK